MKLHAIMVTKNEGDVIEYTLRAASAWADRIYVLENGSTDNTWVQVQEMARRSSIIVAHKRIECPFNNRLRADVFNAFRHEAGPDSWWCRLDSDEIYVDDPRSFLATVPRRHHVVWSAHLQYYLTPEDVRRLEPAGERPPVMDATTLPSHYLNNASEARFFRHRARLRWDSGAWPRHMGIVHPRRIRLRHFQYRSPQQMQLRLATRRLASSQGPTFQHVSQKDWRENIVDAARLCRDDGVASLQVKEETMPRHLESGLQRCVKHILHGLRIWP